MKIWDHLFRNARIATMAVEGAPYGILESASLAVHQGRIVWLGPDSQLPREASASRVEDCSGRLLTPGLIDCHTHLVYGGDRVREFEMRLEGVSYAEISRQGGGIVSTVKATRQSSEDDLLEGARRRLRCLSREGVTSVEIKSGYGLDTHNEVKMLRAARRLGETMPQRVVTSFLGAHAVPPEMAGDSDAYLDLVIHETLPAVAAENLADAVDAFCEHIAFSPEQISSLFRAAVELGLPIKLHAEQLSNLGGAAMAAGFGALSADHLEYLDEAGVLAMAAAGTVAVLLPGAFYFLRETQAPPVELLRRHGVPIAVATDCNPGSSPMASLLLALNMSCILFGLTPAEALAGATRNAARALGLGDEIGTLEVGKRADLALWDTDQPAALVATLGTNHCLRTFVGGQPVDSLASPLKPDSTEPESIA